MGRLAVPITIILMCGALIAGSQAQTVGNWPGEISSGRCRCKDQCEAGYSIFSEGRSVAQCKRKCQQAFAGCTKGEIRSYQRRD